MDELEGLRGRVLTCDRVRVENAMGEKKGSRDVDDGATVRLVDSTSQLIHGFGTKA